MTGTASIHMAEKCKTQREKGKEKDEERGGFLMAHEVWKGYRGNEDVHT